MGIRVSSEREQLSVLVGLTEQGVNPLALAEVVKELRRESAAIAAEQAAGAAPTPSMSAEERARIEAQAFKPPRK